MPHHLTIDVGRAVTIQGISYLARQDMANGRVAEAELYCSNDRKQWGRPVAQLRFRDRGDLQTVRLAEPVKARYLKFVVLSEIHARPYAAVAELDILTDDK
jgi:beta-galactosidase